MSLSFFLVLCILFLPKPTRAAQAIEGNIDDVARAILTYFPKVSGKVSSIDDGRITVDLGPGSGLAEGIILRVFRKGKTFYHPVTEVPLGQFELEVGTIEVMQIESARIIANPIGSEKKIEVGDLVRLPSTRLRLSIALQSEKGHSFLMNELSVALSDSGRFLVDALSAGADLKEALARNNDYHITLATANDGESFSINLQIQNTRTGRKFSDLDVLIRQSEESDLILEHLQYQLFEQRQKKR